MSTSRTDSRIGRRRVAVWARRARRWAVVAVTAGLAVSGCRDLATPDRDAEQALDPDEFVDLVVAIRKAEQEARYQDSAAVVFDRLKGEILAEHEATEDEIRDFVRIHAADFELMAEVWDSITQRLKYVPPDHDPSLQVPAPDSVR